MTDPVYHFLELFAMTKRYLQESRPDLFVKKVAPVKIAVTKAPFVQKQPEAMPVTAAPAQLEKLQEIKEIK
jgi:hypothetical protein